MKKEYNLTMEQAVTLATEFLKNSPKRRRTHRLLIFAAPVLACAYALYRPPTASLGEQPAPMLALVLAVLVQIPLVALLLYLVFRVALDLPIRAAARMLQKQPKEFWGRRTVEVDNGEVSLRRDPMSQSFKVSYVDSVVETTNGIHLTHAGQVLISMPKTECSVEEMELALKETGSNQPSQPIAGKPGSG